MRKASFWGSFIFAICLCSCSSSELDQDGSISILNEREDISLTRAEAAASDASNVFAYNYIKTATDLLEDNFIVSPLSAEVALAMLCNGATGETLENIKSVLGFDGFTLDDLNSYNKTILSSLPELDKLASFKSANALWAKDSFKFNESYASSVTSNFNAYLTYFVDLATAKKK